MSALRRSCRQRVMLRVALGAAAVAVCLGPVLAEEPPERADQTTKAEERKASGPASEPPRGITVLVPNWVPPADPRSYPVGVTVLGGSAQRSGQASEQAERSEIRIVVVPGTAKPEEERQRAPETSEEGFDLVQRPERVQPGADELPPPTIGPNAEQQLAAFPRQSRAGGSPIPEWIGWNPTSAYPDRESERPYPWHPAKFDGLSDRAVWTPESALASRDPTRPYPWHPASFDSPPGWSLWEPQDAWGRALSGSEVIVPWISEGESDDGEPSP